MSKGWAVLGMDYASDRYGEVLVTCHEWPLPSEQMAHDWASVLLRAQGKRKGHTFVVVNTAELPARVRVRVPPRKWDLHRLAQGGQPPEPKPAEVFLTLLLPVGHPQPPRSVVLRAEEEEEESGEDEEEEDEEEEDKDDPGHYDLTVPDFVVEHEDTSRLVLGHYDKSFEDTICVYSDEVLARRKRKASKPVTAAKKAYKAAQARAAKQGADAAAGERVEVAKDAYDAAVAAAATAMEHVKRLSRQFITAEGYIRAQLEKATGADGRDDLTLRSIRPAVLVPEKVEAVPLGLKRSLGSGGSEEELPPSKAARLDDASQ